MKCLFTFLITFIALTSKAQTVGYTYKPLAAEGCSMRYSISKQDTIYYIIATVESDRLKFLKESTMMIRTFDDEVIKLEGALIDNDTQSVGIMSGNIMIPVPVISSTAQFIVTPSQLKSLKVGIAKVRLSTIPITHERSFKKDKIGKKLYEFYLKEKNKDDSF
jgi:hypothetical protein